VREVVDAVVDMGDLEVVGDRELVEYAAWTNVGDG
jgi:hypothetical protein